MLIVVLFSIVRNSLLIGAGKAAKKFNYHRDQGGSACSEDDGQKDGDQTEPGKQAHSASQSAMNVYDRVLKDVADLSAEK